MNQNNSHNARGKRFLWVSDICMKSRDFCPLKTLVSQCRAECQTSPGVTAETQATVSFFPESLQPKLWALQGPRSSIHFLRRLKAMLVGTAGIFFCAPTGRAEVLCSSPVCRSQLNSVPFFADLCASWGLVAPGRPLRREEKRGRRGLAVPPWLSCGREISWLRMWLWSQAWSRFKSQLHHSH